MLHKEWSLIANSLLVQMAAGIFLFIGIFRQIATDAASTEPTTIVVPGMLLAGLSLALGMLISLFHVGNPLRAYRAVTNLRSSWMSREVLFTAVFFGLWLVYIICESNGIYIRYLIWLTMFAAIFSVVSMASIYYSTGNRGWRSVNTYTEFMESVIILGGAATSVLITNAKEVGSSLVDLLKISVFLFIVFVAIKLSQQVALMISLKSVENTWSVDSLVAGTGFEKLGTEKHKVLTIWGIVLSSCGAGIAAVALFTGPIRSAGPHLIISTALILTGEALCRAGFYSLYCRDAEKPGEKPGRS